MGLSDYGQFRFGGLSSMRRPIMSRQMPVHDWLRDYYGEDKHLELNDPDPSTEQGSGVDGNYIAVVEKNVTFFT